MTLLIIIFGALILIAGIVIVINPKILFDYLRNNMDKLILHSLAVATRLAIGTLLIYQANISKYPFAIEVLGWFSISAGLFLGVMGRKNFRKLMTWTLNFFKPFGRVGGILGIAFGAFLIYAFVS